MIYKNSNHFYGVLYMSCIVMRNGMKLTTLYEPVTVEDYRIIKKSSGFLDKLDLAELTPLRTLAEKDTYTYHINNQHKRYIHIK